VKQGSNEWFQARLGKVTASRIGDLMATTKSGPAASRKNYIMELLCQRLTGEREEGFTSSAMQWGTETEPLARAEYEALTGQWVEEVGFIDHPTIKGFGASPDGLCGDGCIEIKCPNTATHISTLFEEKVQQKYVYQMMGVMMCADKKWCDFVSYDPRLPDKAKIKVIRFLRDEEMEAEMTKAITTFLAELDKLESKVRAL
jgi:putative phage-type endonuclease